MDRPPQEAGNLHGERAVERVGHQGSVNYDDAGLPRVVRVTVRAASQGAVRAAGCRQGGGRHGPEGVHLKVTVAVVRPDRPSLHSPESIPLTAAASARSFL